MQVRACKCTSFVFMYLIGTCVYLHMENIFVYVGMYIYLRTLLVHCYVHHHSYIIMYAIHFNMTSKKTRKVIQINKISLFYRIDRPPHIIESNWYRRVLLETDRISFVFAFIILYFPSLARWNIKISPALFILVLNYIAKLFCFIFSTTHKAIYLKPYSIRTWDSVLVLYKNDRGNV